MNPQFSTLATAQRGCSTLPVILELIRRSGGLLVEEKVEMPAIWSSKEVMKAIKFVVSQKMMRGGYIKSSLSLNKQERT